MIYATKLDVRARIHQDELLLIRGPIVIRLTSEAMRLWHCFAQLPTFNRETVRSLSAEQGLKEQMCDNILELLVKRGFIDSAETNEISNMRLPKIKPEC